MVGFLVYGCGQGQEFRIAGETMGTTYRVKVVGSPFTQVGKLRELIKTRLEQINQRLSVYLPDSEINRFNNAHDTTQVFPLSADMRQVLQTAKRLYTVTGGAWDATVKPLVDLWGFGTQGSKHSPPSPVEIKARLARIGFEFVQITPAGLRKFKKEITLDLGSIAKGYAVDQISALLKANRYTDFLVEIGGEVYASGYRVDGKPWRVGINTPRTDAGPEEVYKIISLNDRALATSGDYRNFFFAHGKRYAHILDPATGFPVGNGVVSVSILAASCALADGLATALVVMGPHRGIALLNRLEQVEGLMLVESENGRLTPYVSEGWQTLQSEGGNTLTLALQTADDSLEGVKVHAAARQREATNP